MGQVLVLVLLVAFLIRTIRNSLYQVFLWQLKEYRLDRILAHLQTWQGRRMVLGPMALVKWVLILAYFLGLPIFFAVMALYLFEALLNLREATLGIKKPVFTFKAVTVLGLVITGELLLFFRPLINLALWVLILDKALALIVAIIFLVLAIPTKIQRELVINRAKEIIKNHPKLLVIGITGSYGKTSTKEFLSQLLSRKYKVLKTEASNNTDIGIAQTIVDNLRDQQVFICEMAAYKRGEIKDICEMVHPQIGIVTAINEQHLELFGSIENTMAAKFELIKALPRAGLAVFNGNNQYTRQLADKAKKRPLITIIYQYEDISPPGEPEFIARIIKVLPRKLEFEIKVGNEKIQTTAPLLGTQNIENIMACVVVSYHLGMNLSEIAKAIENLQPPEMTMKPHDGPGHSTLIDDTFNANPDGVSAAITYMKIYPGRKILVFQPMIELGGAASRLHREVGESAAKVCDLIFLTNKNFNGAILQGARLVKNGTDKIFLFSSKKAVSKIKEGLTKDDVVVFEGKEARKYLEQIKPI